MLHIACGFPTIINIQMTKPAVDLSILLSRVAARDGEAFAQLYRATHLKLFGIVLRILRRHDLAEDILQEIYVRIWDRASSFDPGRGSPIAWLAAIARNRALDELRRARKSPDGENGDDGDVELVPDPEKSPAEKVEVDEELLRLEECLGKLEEEQRDAVRLAYLDGLSRKELADRFGRPLGTVKSWLRRSLKQLKDCLGT